MKRFVSSVHFVGIGGIGMSGLAELLLRQGYRVSGSDLRESAKVERLRGLGIDVAIGHAAGRLDDTELLVYSSAVGPGNPELAEARALGLPAIGRGELLAELMRGHDGIAVAGSHGKTTTSALITHLLARTSLDPTAVVGGHLLGRAAERSGVRVGAGPLFVAEADESDGSFLRLTPRIAVVTNVDAEHLEHYGRYQDVQEAFLQFTQRVPFFGLCVLCDDDPGLAPILERSSRRVVRYGLTRRADLGAFDVRDCASGMRFGVRRGGADLGRIELPLPGRHNVANALAALAVALELDVPFDRAAAALEDFAGVERRFQRLGREAGVELIDDYAHHPAELRATLASARAMHAGRLVAIFQPHRYSRTRDCFEELGRAFDECDLLIVSEIYAAGEEPIEGVSGRTLAEAIAKQSGCEVHFMAELDAIRRALPEHLRHGDRVLTLGAGDITTLGPDLLARLRQGAAR